MTLNIVGQRKDCMPPELIQEATTTTEVTPAETETAPATSAEEQTTQPEETPTEAIETPAEEPKVETNINNNNIPYERFKGVNDKLKEAQDKLAQYETAKPELSQQEATISETLKKLGFITKEEQQKTLQERDEDSAMQANLNKLETQYNGQDGSPKFKRVDIIDFCIKNGLKDPEMGYKLMNEKAIIDAKVKAALGTNVSVPTEASNGSGKVTTTKSQDFKDAFKLSPNSAEGKAALHNYLQGLSKS